MMMSNQLKQIAKNYNIFISSSTQVNINAMMDDGSFKNETCIRGAKSIADKADMACVMTKISEKTWNSFLPQLRVAARQGIIDNMFIDNEKPTHVIDIYKMRRGRYKNVRIWTYMDLGTGKRKDLFITTSDNQPIREVIDLFSSASEQIIEDWKEI